MYFNKKICVVALTCCLAAVPTISGATWFERFKTYITTSSNRNEPKPPYQHNKGLLSENEKAEAKTQRENHYTWSQRIAEFWCTLSNAPLVYVGYKHNAPEVTLAGAVSTCYHAHPTQKLLIADRACAVAAGLGVFLRAYRAHGKVPKQLLWILPFAAGVAIADDVIANTASQDSWWFKLTPLWHSIWHSSAAYCAHVLLKSAKK